MNRFFAYGVIVFLAVFMSACSSTQEVRKPPQLRFDSPVLSKGIHFKGNKGIPIDPTAVFSTQDKEVIASLKLRNLSGKHLLRWDWYDPSGSLYHSTGNHPVEASKGKYLKETTSWHKLSVDGEKAADSPGGWKVNIYLDNEFIASKSFKIGSDVQDFAAVKIDVDINIPKTEMNNRDAVALVIGNSNYRHLDVPTVKFARHDAQIMKQYLTKTLGYREGNIIYETDITKARFEALLGISGNHRGTLYDYIKPHKSDVFFYYSGHGAPDPNTRKGYFVPVDSDPSKVEFSGYSLDTFYENMAKLDAKSITVVIDACFSGGTSSGELLIRSASPIGIAVNNPAIAEKNTIIMTSSTGSQISSWYDEKGHGLFTYFFLKALGGAGDMNGDKQLTFAEINDFVSDRAEGVPYWAKRLHGGRVQTPTLQGNTQWKALVRY